MKTKTRTFIGLVALGVIGLTNIKATAANIGMNTAVAVETEENLTVEASMLDSNIWMENTETKAEIAVAGNALEAEAGMSEEDFFRAAESYTAAGSDEEIEKYAIKQWEKSVEKADTESLLEINAWMSDDDFFKAAEAYTALGADKEVKKYANKQIALENERESK